MASAGNQDSVTDTENIPPGERPARRRVSRRTWTIGAVMLVLVIAIVVAWRVWDKVLLDRFYPRRWGVVVPGRIYRSGQISEHLIRSTLEENGIEVILVLAGPGSFDVDQQAENQAAEELGIRHVRIQMLSNGVATVDDYVKALSVLIEARREGKVALVHCNAGSNRTGGVVALYRVLVEGWPGRDAYEEMCRYDWHPSSNGKLLTFLNNNLSAIADRLAATGAMETIPAPLPRIEPRP